MMLIFWNGMNDNLNSKFSMDEVKHVLGIKIYGDRLKRLITLSRNTFLDKILKGFRIDQAKKKFLLEYLGKALSLSRYFSNS